MRNSLFLMLLGVGLALAQGNLKQRPPEPEPGFANAGDSVRLDAGTHILLRMVNSVSTRHAQVGDRLYLETAYPVFGNGRLLVPQGSWVMGTVTSVKQPAHVKGKGELQIHFDSLTLPNGVSREFHSDLGGIDQVGDNSLDREKSGVQSPSNKGTTTARTVGGAAAGTGIGTIIGSSAGHAVGGAIVGAAGGAAGGLLATMFSRGPDATLPSGSTVEMVLDRPLIYKTSELPSK
jgi:type IV secretion system protein VirB10